MALQQKLLKGNSEFMEVKGKVKTRDPTDTRNVKKREEAEVNRTTLV